MAEYTELQLFVHDCPDDQAAALLGVLRDYELRVDWDGPYVVRDVRIGTPYTDRKVAGDASADLARDLMQAAPGVSFTVWTDPAYDFQGLLMRYTPELGLHQADCDINGQAIFTGDEVMRALRADHDDIGIRRLVGTAWTDALTGHTVDRTIVVVVADD